MRRLRRVYSVKTNLVLPLLFVQRRDRVAVAHADHLAGDGLRLRRAHMDSAKRIDKALMVALLRILNFALHVRNVGFTPHLLALHLADTRR